MWSTLKGYIPFQKSIGTEALTTGGSYTIELFTSESYKKKI